MGKSRQPEVWGDAPPLEAAAGAAAVAALRAVAGATDPARLAGGKEAAFTAEVDMKKRPCRLSLRTTKTSQQVVVAIDIPPFAPKKLEDLGMSAEMVASVRDLLAREKGLFLVSSPPAAGGSTLFDMVLMTADRLLRDFVSIESAAAPAKEVQNVKPVRFDPAAGESPVDALNKAMLEYPAAVVTRDIADKQLAASLLDLADDQRLVIVGVRAADAVDAIEKLLALGVPRDQLARCLLGSVSQRLIRKLCPQCGDPQPASPELLQRLKRTAEEVPSIKRASPHGGCRTCAGRQYMGRAAIFELAAGPTVKQAIAKAVDGKVLRQAAVKDGMRPLADAGLAMVAAGQCSLEELQRVFAVKKEAGPAGAKR
jgi:type II secretory ATPase GspE/PulE/Tfp pilus assembly ATPase PilB-like protein